jgi:hypothetical protein
MRPTLAAFLSGILVAVGSAAAADPPVSGKFTGNGKEAKLQFVSAQKGEPYLDKPTIKLIFTEKDHSKDKRPDIAAGFGDFGSALVITVNEDGKIIGCVVAHGAHEKKGFTSLGSIAMSDFKAADGKVTGKIKTNGVVDTFGQKWQVDIQFEAKAP